MLIIFVELRPLPAHRRADVLAVLLLIACDILLRALDELLERFVVHLRRHLLDLRIPRAEVVIRVPIWDAGEPSRPLEVSILRVRGARQSPRRLLEAFLGHRLEIEKKNPLTY